MRKNVGRILGTNIRERRRSMDLSLKQLGKTLGVSYQQVQKYEKGTNRMPVEMLVSVAELFGCSLDEMCGLRQPQLDLEMATLMKRVSAIPSPALCRKLVELLEVLDADSQPIAESGS